MRRITDEKRQAIRDAYQTGLTYHDISQIHGVARSTIAEICGDLAQRKRDQKVVMTPEESRIRKLSRAREIYADKNFARKKHHGLTVDIVVAIRRSIRADGHMRLKKYAELYGVEESVVSVAARGHTFKNADQIEPPITEKLRLPPKPRKRFILDPALAQEATDKRREDPGTWTYSKLAAWLREQTGKGYKSTHVCRLILKIDPSLKALENTQIAPVRKSRTPKQITERKPRTAVQKEARRKNATIYRESLKRYKAEADKLEREAIAAGRG